jgi:hypothetical protein
LKNVVYVHPICENELDFGFYFMGQKRKNLKTFRKANTNIVSQKRQKNKTMNKIKKLKINI